MEFLRANLSQSFMDKDFKTHQANSILAQAEAEIGQYQERANYEIRIEKAKIKLDEAKRIYRLAIAGPWARLCQAEEEYRVMVRDVRLVPKEQRSDFFLACPRAECRGRVSSGYKCGLCYHFFCPQCHWDKGLVRDVEHECAQDDIDTVRMLRENTRNCPKCKMGIFKTEGCDQMWCVSCKTAFSWRSGNILNGPIHNPEYYDFQRRQQANGNIPRQPGDVLCGGMPGPNTLRQRILANGEDSVIRKRLTDTHRVILHIEEMTMPSIHRKYNQRPQLFQTHGIAYLRGLIDRMGLRDRLYKATRQEEKFRRYYQVLETLTMNIQEVMRQYVVGQINGKTADQGCTEMFAFANEAFDRMRKQFKMSIPIFSADMDTTRL
jgi:hypothetical protein